MINSITTGDGNKFLLQMSDGYQGLYLATFDASTGTVSTPQSMNNSPGGWIQKPSIMGNTAYLFGQSCFGNANCPGTSPYGILAYDMALGQFTNFFSGFSGSCAFSGSDSSSLYVLYGDGVTAYDITQASPIPFASYNNPDGINGNSNFVVARGQFADTFAVLGGVTQNIINPPANELIIWSEPRVPFISSVVNGAPPYDARAATPGAWWTVFGRSLSFQPTTCNPTVLGQCDTAQVALTYGGKTVYAPLFYVSPNQENFQVPWDAPVGSATVSVAVQTINADGSWTASNAVTLDIAATSPGIFVTTGSGVNTASSGGNLTLWCNGLGPVNQTIVAGQPAPSSPLAKMITPPTVTVGGNDATVTFSGLAPGNVGLYQINVQLPSLPTGTYNVVISAGGNSSGPAAVQIQ
jgi:uncharacterized protein (TIGR03437 family)